MLLATGAFCSDLENITNEQTNSTDIIEKSRDAIGDAYQDLAVRLDHFMSRSDLVREANKSRLSLGLGNTWYSDGEQEYDIKLRTRVDLPGTEEKFKLYFESDPDENKSLAERNRSVARNNRVNRNNSVAGIEYSKPTSLSRWKHSGSVGGSYSDGIDLLLRYRLRRYWQIAEDSTLLFRQDIWHKSSIGWGETSHVELNTELHPELWLNISADVELRDHDQPMDYANIWRLEQKISDQWRFTYKLGLLGEADEDRHIFDDRFINTTFEYRLQREWISIYLTPEIYYPEENNYHADYSFTLTCSFLLTDEPDP